MRNTFAAMKSHARAARVSPWVLSCLSAIGAALVLRGCFGNLYVRDCHEEAPAMQVPLPAESVDVVISNCVINLSTDKPAVLTEMARVLRPGGRLGISDVVAEDRLSPAERAERGSYCGCVAGALSRGEYVAGLEAAGFEDVSVDFTHEVAEGMHGAIVRGVKTA